MTVPGGNPLKAPTLVPMSPVTIEAPVLVKAPFAVNREKLEAVPKLGVCP